MAGQHGMGKMSPWLRQLARQATASASRTDAQGHHRDGFSVWDDKRTVCAFVRLNGDAGEVMQCYGSRVLTKVGNVCVAQIPLSQLRPLAADKRVERLEARPVGEALCDTMAYCLNAHPAYEGRNLPQAFTGQGVMVGVMDIGFDLTHPNFYTPDTTQYRIQRLWDMLSADTVGSAFPVGRDYEGREALLALAHCRDGLDQTHGTHTLGIAAGSGYDSRYRGMAPDADISLVANAVSDDVVYIDTADYYKYTFATDALGFKYLFDHAERQGQPCVVSFSEGSGQDFWGYDQLYYEMLDSLVGPGRILVAAAGNTGLVKSWFRKPVGTPSVGTFLEPAASKASFTVKSADAFSLRFVGYASVPETLVVDSREVLECPDSLFTATMTFDDGRITVEVEAYPSCYDERETCYDVMVRYAFERKDNVVPLSAEVVGESSDAEVFRVYGFFGVNALDPSLNAGEYAYSINSPASAPRVIAVGATSYRDGIVNYRGDWKSYWTGNGGVRVPFSSVGPTFDGRIKPDVMAPGNNIVSSYSSFYAEQHPTAGDLTWDVARFAFNGRTYSWNSNSGTSMSCPAVAGAIALWLQAKPDLTPEEVKDVLDHTCRRYDASLSYPNNEYGYGEMDVYGGLLYLLGVDKIEEVARQHTSARISCSDGVMHVALPEPCASPVLLRLYNMSGRQMTMVTIPAGQTRCQLLLGALPHGIYAVQLDGAKTVSGSTLIRL